jgi:uncharacterized protein (DUF169 family)
VGLHVIVSKNTPLLIIIWKETVMTNEQIQETIRNVVGVKKEFVGIKAWEDEPQGIPKYKEKAFPGMCTQIGEVLKTGETFYTDKDQHFCTGGVVATGVIPAYSREESIEIVKMHLEITNDHQDSDTAVRYHDEMQKQIPPVKKKNTAAQLGLFKDIKDPDIVLIFCSPGAADIINRAFSYVTGEPIQGFGGNGGCPFAIQYPYVTRKPSFTYSDISWRKHVGLADDELTISFPYQDLTRFIDSFPEVAEQYRKYGEEMET